MGLQSDSPELEPYSSFMAVLSMNCKQTAATLTIGSGGKMIRFAGAFSLPRFVIMKIKSVNGRRMAVREQFWWNARRVYAVVFQPRRRTRFGSLDEHCGLGEVVRLHLERTERRNDD